MTEVIKYSVRVDIDCSDSVKPEESCVILKPDGSQLPEIWNNLMIATLVCRFLNEALDIGISHGRITS